MTNIDLKSPQPWACRHLGLRHYTTTPRGVCAGLLCGAIVYALGLVASISVDEGAREMLKFVPYAVLITAIGIPLVAGLPWAILHAIGFRGPVAAALLGPFLSGSICALAAMPVSVASIVIALSLVSGLAIWFVAYAPADAAIDPAVFE